MAEFIIVHEAGEERLVNLAWVEEIRCDEDQAIIYFAFRDPDCVEQDNIKTDEPYEAVKKMIWRGIE